MNRRGRKRSSQPPTRPKSRSRSRSRSRPKLAKSEVQSTEKRRLSGGFRSLDKKSLKKLQPNVMKSFTELSKKYKDFNLIFERILSGKSQFVAGVRYVLTVECTNPEEEVKICKVDIWEQAWLNFVQVKLTYEKNIYEIEL